MQGLPSSGWVTFGGSSPDSPPRSPIHDAWATPSAASSMAHELPAAEASTAVHRLQLEPSAASEQDMPEIEECSVTTEDAHGAQAPHCFPHAPSWSPGHAYLHAIDIQQSACSALDSAAALVCWAVQVVICAQCLEGSRMVLCRERPQHAPGPCCAP